MSETDAGFDPLDPRWERNAVPAEVLAAIRRHSPVHPIPGGGWYAASAAAVAEVLRDVDTFLTDLAGGREVAAEERFLSEIPEPRHGQVRRVYNAAFGPHRLAAIEPYVRDLADRLLDPIVAAGGGDLVPAFAAPIPSRVVARVLGVPEADADAFVRWSFEGGLLSRKSTAAAGGELPAVHGYLQRLLERRRADPDPPDDVITRLMRARVDGGRLSDTEIRTQVQFIVLAGVETTRVLLAHVLHRLLFDADLLARVRADRALVPLLIEETLRRDAPVQQTFRRATRPAQIGGAAVEPGELVVVGIGAANRDETVFEDPEAFRLDRPDPRGHLAFGTGAHVCPGASLARMEAAAALDVLLDRVAGLEPVPGHAYESIPTVGLLTPQSLPARLVAARPPVAG